MHIVIWLSVFNDDKLFCVYRIFKLNEIRTVTSPHTKGSYVTGLALYPQGPSG